MKKIVVLIVINFLLAACSSPYSSVGENIYMKAHNAPMLAVPSPLTSAYISSFYVLPDQNKPVLVNISPE